MKKISRDVPDLNNKERETVINSTLHIFSYYLDFWKLDETSLSRIWTIKFLTRLNERKKYGKAWVGTLGGTDRGEKWRAWGGGVGVGWDQANPGGTKASNTKVNIYLHLRDRQDVRWGGRQTTHSARTDSGKITWQDNRAIQFLQIFITRNCVRAPLAEKDSKRLMHARHAAVTKDNTYWYNWRKNTVITFIRIVVENTVFIKEDFHYNRP